jgi:hypothetical protein
MSKDYIDREKSGGPGVGGYWNNHPIKLMIGGGPGQAQGDASQKFIHKLVIDHDTGIWYAEDDTGTKLTAEINNKKRVIQGTLSDDAKTTKRAFDQHTGVDHLDGCRVAGVEWILETNGTMKENFISITFVDQDSKLLALPIGKIPKRHSHLLDTVNNIIPTVKLSTMGATNTIGWQFKCANGRYTAKHTTDKFPLDILQPFKWDAREKKMIVHRAEVSMPTSSPAALRQEVHRRHRILGQEEFDLTDEPNEPIPGVALWESPDHTPQKTASLLSQLTEEAERLDKERQRAESQAEADRLTISRLKGEVEDAKNKALVEEKEKNRLGLLYNEHCQQLEAQQNLITQLNTQVLTLQEQIKSNEVLIKSYKRKREQELQSPEVAETIKRATNILTAIRGTPTK